MSVTAFIIVNNIVLLDEVVAGDADHDISDIEDIDVTQTVPSIVCSSTPVKKGMVDPAPTPISAASISTEENPGEKHSDSSTILYEFGKSMEDTSHSENNTTKQGQYNLRKRKRVNQEGTRPNKKAKGKLEEDDCYPIHTFHDESVSQEFPKEMIAKGLANLSFQTVGMSENSLLLAASEPIINLHNNDLENVLPNKKYFAPLMSSTDLHILGTSTFNFGSEWRIGFQTTHHCCTQLKVHYVKPNTKKDKAKRVKFGLTLLKKLKQMRAKKGKMRKSQIWMLRDLM